MKRSKSLPSPWYRQDKHGKPILHKMDPLEDELCRAVLLYKTDSSSVYERHELLSQCNQIVSLGIQEEINQLITLLQQLGILWPDLDILEILDRLEAGAVQLKHLSVSLGSSSYSLGEMRQEHRSCHLVDLIVRYLGSLNNLGEELKKEKESVRKLVKRHNLELETEEWREEEEPEPFRKHSHRYSIGDDLKRDRSRKVSEYSDLPSSSGHGRFSLDYTALQLQQREHRLSRDHNRRSFDQYGRPIRHSIDHSAGRPHLQHDPKPRRTSETRLEYSRLDKRSVDNTTTSNRAETNHNRTRWSIFETIRERSDVDIVPDPVAEESQDREFNEKLRRKSSKKVSIAENLNCDYSDDDLFDQSDPENAFTELATDPDPTSPDIDSENKPTFEISDSKGIIVISVIVLILYFLLWKFILF